MIYAQHFVSLLRHKWFVFVAGLKTGVPLWRLIIHDWSKFTLSEFPQYARAFQGDYSESPVDKSRTEADFQRAWLHHIHHNPHHWQYWIYKSSGSGNVIFNMPETYVREMIADWMGASRAYTGSFDMCEWLDKNFNRITLSSDTYAMTKGLLKRQGYELNEQGWTKQ
jgi:hypothetical protein